MRKLLGLASVGALVLLSGAALAKPPVPIAECGAVIADPGKYVLANDLVGCETHAILIVGSDINLDLNGHSISCDTNGGMARLGGVVVWSPDWSLLSNVTVRNGHVFDCSDGVLMVHTEGSKIKDVSAGRSLSSHGASGTGITVWYSENTSVTKTHTYDNEQQGIAVWDSIGTLVKHNVATTSGAGIWAERVDGIEISCNKVLGNGTGLLLGPWSTGSLVKGNLAKWNWFDGISAWGWTWDDGSWDEIAAGNKFKHNVSEENPFDHVELAYNLDSGAIFPHPDGMCRNAWFENQFGTSWGPADCIGEPVQLDPDDVCAFDDE